MRVLVVEDNEPDEDEPGRWVLGQLAAGDPEDTIAGARPTAIFFAEMPSSPAPSGRGTRSVRNSATATRIGVVFPMTAPYGSAGSS